LSFNITWIVHSVASNNIDELLPSAEVCGVIKFITYDWFAISSTLLGFWPILHTPLLEPAGTEFINMHQFLVSSQLIALQGSTAPFAL